MKQSKRHVEAVKAALDIMDCFIMDTSLNIRQLMQKTALTRNRIMRIGGTLCHKGYLSYDPESGNFGLGLKILSLSRSFVRNHFLINCARPILKEIAQRTGETASLFVREGLDRVVLAKEEGTQEVRHTVEEGQRMELYAGAAGKTLLAFAPQDVLDALFSEKQVLEKTPETIIKRDELLKELETIRRERVAVSLGERVLDVCAIAAPVFTDHDTLVAAINIAGPMSRFPLQKRIFYKELIIQNANYLSGRLGYSNSK